MRRVEFFAHKYLLVEYEFAGRFRRCYRSGRVEISSLRRSSKATLLGKATILAFPTALGEKNTLIHSRQLLAANFPEGIIGATFETGSAASSVTSQLPFLGQFFIPDTPT